MTDILPFPSGRNHSRSGTGPAENEPSPAPSGTSGTVLENSSDNSEPPPAMPAAEDESAPVLVPEVADVPPASNSESFLPNSLPDVPDVAPACRTHAGQVPDRSSRLPDRTHLSLYVQRLSPHALFWFVASSLSDL